jgi:hypothetical protein
MLKSNPKFTRNEDGNNSEPFKNHTKNDPITIPIFFQIIIQKFFEKTLQIIIQLVYEYIPNNKKLFIKRAHWPENYVTNSLLMFLLQYNNINHIRNTHL